MIINCIIYSYQSLDNLDSAINGKLKWKMQKEKGKMKNAKWKMQNEKCKNEKRYLLFSSSYLILCNS